MTAKRKNRSENGIRAELFGSNPHSNGESFSRSWLDRDARNQDKINTMRETSAANKDEKSVRCIWLQGTLWSVFRVKT